MSIVVFNSEALPGLDLRVRAALARVRLQTVCVGAEDALIAIYEDAEEAGYRAYRAGTFVRPPELIAGDTALLQGWEAGQDAAAVIAAICADGDY